jgi:hypothetical protein
MRLRVGVVLCLFLAFWGAGCRKAVAPAVDNAAPETWIVAAPQDTITTRDPSNTPIRPTVGRIPVRFHMYWAGSDRDGAVVGYYFAVVETLPVPPQGTSTVPGLPGPKPRDYHYTTKQDSIFIFRASEDLNERQHAFYIYAVDDKGRADPTPARFIFSSYDRFPPLAIIDELKAVGTIYSLIGGTLVPSRPTYFVRDSFEISDTHFVPRDTVPANAQLSMRWHGEPTIPSTVVTGYRYKLDESDFNTVDSSVHQASYNTGVGTDKVNPGQKIFTLRAIGQSGWRGESTRWFQMNFAPDTWFSGPDKNDPAAGWLTYTDFKPSPKQYWYKDMLALGWPGQFELAEGHPGVPGTMLSSDSTALLPALRPERRTFFEIYNDQLWYKEEGDTVHLNSWVVLPAGGFDQDSPYSVKVNLPLMATSDHFKHLVIPPQPVTTPSGPNGSPIGFRIQVKVKEGTDPTNRAGEPSETTTYPVYDPASVFHQPVINGYWGLTTAGKAYAVVRAEDGNGEVDRRIDHQPGGAIGVADRVDNGGASDEDRALRSKILTFYVDKAPTLRQRDPAFHPRTNETWASRTLQLNNLFILSDDVDPFDPAKGAVAVGGLPPGQPPILRFKIAILGKLTGDPTRDTCFVGAPDGYNSPGAAVPFVIPPYIATGNITVRIRICDCAQCDDLRWPSQCPFASPEATPGGGRCAETDIPVHLTAPEPASIIGTNGSTQRPGSPSDPGRRQP